MNWKTFLSTLIAVPVLDFVWLGFVMPKFYMEKLDGIVRVSEGRVDVVYWAAGAVYLLLALGMAVLVEPKIQNAGSVFEAALYSALFGFVVYGVYDFTNHATLKTWPVALLAADVAWGAFVCGACGVIAYFIRD